MARFKTPLEIYALLPKTNCGDCGISTCLAFAAAVLKEEKRPADCTHLKPEAGARLAGNVDRQSNMESIREAQLRELKEKIAASDIPSRAERLGARSAGDRLVITCLGKEFAVDQSGAVASQCHTHAWFSLPLLDYILHCEGAEPSGRWAPFRELERRKTWNPLFEQRCEKPLKRIADSHSDLFEDLVSMFSGTSSDRAFNSDIAVVLLPLPRVPVLICYWKPEDGMESQLHLFFDDTAERNLPPGVAFHHGDRDRADARADYAQAYGREERAGVRFVLRSSGDLPGCTGRRGERRRPAKNKKALLPYFNHSVEPQDNLVKFATCFFDSLARILNASLSPPPYPSASGVFGFPVFRDPANR